MPSDGGLPNVRFTPESGHVRCGSHVRFTPKKRTSRHLFDHLVGEQQERFGYREAKRLGRLEIDNELELVR